MYYRPAYQKRLGHCESCGMGIEAGDKVVIGTGYWNKTIIRKRHHWQCYLDNILKAGTNWFFANDYVPTAMDKDKKAALNRLRAKRYYIKQHGGEPNEVLAAVKSIEREIALVKSG